MIIKRTSEDVCKVPFEFLLNQLSVQNDLDPYFIVSATRPSGYIVSRTDTCRIRAREHIGHPICSGMPT